MQLSDRELLELAAKAAGISHWKDDELWDNWNPLDDSCDAFYLMVKLNMDVGLNHPEACIKAAVDEDWITEPWGDDPYAATRRAITRAAAEIGKGMK